MKQVAIILFLLGIFTSLYAQQVTISATDTDYKSYSSELSGREIQIKDEAENVLVTADYAMASLGDESFKVYPLDNGGFIVRENIANFLWFDTFGKVKRSISNSTQSEGGESISELALDPNGVTVIAYNPKVISDGITGSRAQRIDPNKSPVGLYFSTDRALKSVSVTPDGALVAFVSEKEGTDDRVTLMDRFGNELQNIDFDQDVEGVSLSENGLYATIYSSGRAAAYQVRSGERVGSASRLGDYPLKYAAYDPVEKTLIGITASGSATWNNVEAHAISVSKRKIIHESYSGVLKPVQGISFKREGSGSYVITGLDKEFMLKVNF